ncbi:hypothetical protein FNF28_07214 [Cafeteria roenbergensis]|uniref:Uncharacterized protein n=1 Tax=Cafeteria roenbergensis TaxID=33653 RepID=A0A5A8CCX1_CAFRO|nr:hypothetical protein FNF28_07214 [Cafeteria roenbergensis]
MSSMAHAALEEAWVGSLSGTNGSEILDTLGQIAAAAASGAVGLAVVREVVRLSADRDVDDSGDVRAAALGVASACTANGASDRALARALTGVAIAEIASASVTSPGAVVAGLCRPGKALASTGG